MSVNTEKDNKSLLKQLHVGALPDEGHAFAYPEAVPHHLMNFAKGGHHSHKPVKYEHESTESKQVNSDLDRIIHLVNPNIDDDLRNEKTSDADNQSKRHHANAENKLPPVEIAHHETPKLQLPDVYTTAAQYQAFQKADVAFHAGIGAGRKLTTKEERELLKKYSVHEEKVLEKLVADALEKYNTATAFVVQREISLRRVKQLIKQLSNSENNLNITKLAARELTTLAKELKSLGLKCVEKVRMSLLSCVLFVVGVFFDCTRCMLSYLCRLHFGCWKKRR